MKKKIVSILAAALMLFGSVSALAAETNRAILLCYDAGRLVYSALLTVGEYKEIPAQYEAADKKVYLVDEDRFMTIEEYDAVSSATAAVETAAPEQTPAATVVPANTPAPAATVKPSNTLSSDSPYERAGDGTYAPALVTEVSTSINSKGDEVYAVTMFYQGKEITAGIATDLKISTAPAAYSYVTGKTADALQKGDVISLTSNIAGDKVKRIDLVFRPTEEDIVTGDTDYGANFEKLLATNGQWSFMKYGQKPSKDKYQYAFGVVGTRNGNAITLVSQSENPDDVLDIYINPKAYVYACDVSGKEYDFEIGSVGDIEPSLSSKVLSEDKIVLDDRYSYNYALVRLVDDEATDIVLFSNYNE